MPSDMDWNIADSLLQAAARRPEQTGLIMRAGRSYRRWTFAELTRITDFFAARLTARGIKPRDRIILMVKPSAEFICLTFALFKLGAVVVLIDPGMGYKNVLHCITRLKPTGLIGIPKAHLFKTLFPRAFRSVRINICVGFSGGLFGRSLDVDSCREGGEDPSVTLQATTVLPDDPAAVLFTTGSTGPPKGVCYSHSVFQAQLKLIRDYYSITADDIDQPAFPLFGLFSVGLGACAVIPDMDPSRPARVDPARFVRSIRDHGVTYSFGSPAIWRVVSRYCADNNIKLPSLKKVLMAGAPVPGDLIKLTKSVLEDGEIYTPYGATECLPVSSIAGAEILRETWAKTRAGEGTCVGRALPGNVIKIIPAGKRAIDRWQAESVLPVHEIGEIVVRGAVATRLYENDPQATTLAKIRDGDSFWHRMGDVGYLDAENRLWFCGRAAHRVITATGTLYTICCEAIINEHPRVFRSALVGIGRPGEQVPVMIIEPQSDQKESSRLLAEVKELAGRHPLTAAIEHFFVHPSFPVDIRHNAKIFREKLAVWAADQLGK
jgi:acyl-CoA synthetase (AMP-forming)/AMP-acid ligase II